MDACKSRSRDGFVEVARDEEWIGEHAPPMQLVDEWNRGDGHLAEPEWLERPSGAQVVHQLVETAQVHRVLGEPTRPEHAHADGECRLSWHPRIDQPLVHLGELRTVVYSGFSVAMLLMTNPIFMACLR